MLNKYDHSIDFKLDFYEEVYKEIWEEKKKVQEIILSRNFTDIGEFNRYQGEYKAFKKIEGIYNDVKNRILKEE